MDIYRSSFSLYSFDINQIIVSSIPRFILINQEVEFTIDVSNAGEGQLQIEINNGQVHHQIHKIADRKFRVRFTPVARDRYLISIKFNDQQLPGFPKECQVISSDDIRLHSSDLSLISINKPTWFTIDTLRGSGSSDFQVSIVTPSNQRLSPSTLLTSAGLRVDWTPTEIGTYIIEILLDGKNISGNRFHVKTFDASKVIVHLPSTKCFVGQLTKILVDTSQAGEGNLSVKLTTSSHRLSTKLESLDRNHHEISFTPDKLSLHHCDISFNGASIPGSPFMINISEKARSMVIGKGLGLIPIHLSTSFIVSTQDLINGELKCSIKGPDENFIFAAITKLESNRYEITYTPDRVGEYRIEVFHNNTPIQNSPFTARAFDIKKIRIENLPTIAFVGLPTYFILDATDSGVGNLEIAISRDGKNIPNYVQNEGTARFRIQFIPDQSVAHQIQIKFNGLDVPNSPFSCNVYSNELTLENYEYVPINKPTCLKVKSKLNRQLFVEHIAPNGQIERLSIKNSEIIFVGHQIGEHEIRFYSNEEKKILLSKYLCQVYDIDQIEISERISAIAHQKCRFTIDTTKAGQGNLTIKIKQNQKILVYDQTKSSKDIYEIVFIPETIDDCILKIGFNNDESLDPLIIPVKPIRILSTEIGQTARFLIDTHESDQISVTITESPSGRTVPHTIQPHGSIKNQYEISFHPNISHQHTISIYSKKQLLSKHSIDLSRSNKIHVHSITDGFLGVPCVFSVDTHGAGEGHLEVTIIDGKRTLPAELKSVQARKFDIAFVPQSIGKHSISISFNQIPIDGSPFSIQVRDPLNSSTSEEDDEEEEDDDDYEFIIGGQLEGTKVGEVAWLICEAEITNTYEDFNFYILDPDNVRIKHTRIQDSAGRWRIEFEPRKSGVYQLQTDIYHTTLKLRSMEILSLDYERLIYGERIVHPNMLNFVSINSLTRNFDVQLRNSRQDSIPIEIDNEEDERRIYFTLNQIDVYQLIIRNDSEEYRFDIHCVSEEMDLLRNGGVEDIARVIIDHSKISSDNVNVIVKDSLAHTIPAAFYRNLNNDLIIEYIPVRPDFHEIFIRTQNNLLDICPIRIMAFECNQDFEPVLRVQVNEQLKHTFPEVIDADNKLEIQVTDPFDRIVKFQRSMNSKGELTVSLSPNRVGTHWIRISNTDNDSFALLPIFAYDDDYVPLSPLGTPSLKEKSSQYSDDLTSRLTLHSPEQNNSLHTVNSSMKSDSDMENLDIQELNDPQIGKISMFNYKDPDEQYQLNIYDLNRDLIPYKIKQLPNGRKNLSFEAKLIGPVEIHIAKNDQPISSSPLIVHAFDPSAVKLINFPKRIQINTKCSFLIDPTLAGKGYIRISIKNSNNRSIPIEVSRQSNQHYLVEFEPNLLGSHTMSILFNRIPIPNIPFEFVVEPPQDPPKDQTTTFSQSEIQRLQSFKDKCQQKQPLDTVFDPHKYPFQIRLQHPYPIINSDIHFLITHPNITYIDITLKNQSVPLQLIQKTQQTYVVKFHPLIAGDYSIFFKDSTGQILPNSPYLFPVYNPNGIQIQPVNPLQSITDCHFICNTDNIGQGKFFLMIFSDSQPARLTYKIQLIAPNRLKISFSPLHIGKYQIYLAHRNLPVNDKPIEINVYDTERILLTTEHKEPVLVKTAVSYKVNLSRAGEGHLKAELISPDTSTVACRCYIHELNRFEYLIEYIPNEPGRYQLRILFNNQLYQNKSIDIDVYSLLPNVKSTVEIQQISPKHVPIVIGEEICLKIISIDKRIIYAQITCSDSSVPCKIQQVNQSNIWFLKFRPYLIGNHLIQLTHNGQTLMNSPYVIEVKDSEDKTHLSAFTDTLCMIQVHTKTTSDSKIRAVVLLGGIQIPSKCLLINPNLLRISFLPKQPGFYFVNVYDGEQPVDGSPFVVRIKRRHTVEISGKCLNYLRINDLGVFRVHCHGQQGDVKANIFHLSTNDHRQLISFQLLETYEQLQRFPAEIFLPSMTILLTARLRLTQERIDNFQLEEDNGQAMISFYLIEHPPQIPTNEQIINVLKTLIDKQTLNLVDPDRRILHPIANSLVIGSKGETINVKLFPLSNGDYLGEFTPKKIGQYRIDITYNDKPIDGNPFLTEVYDSSHAKMSSLSNNIQVGVENCFEIDMAQVGKAPMEVTITSSTGNQIPCKIIDLSKSKRVFFTATQTGVHHLKVKLGTDLLPGVPTEFLVKNSNSINAYGDGLERALQDKLAVFMIDTKDLKGDLIVRIEGLNSVIKHNLERINDSLLKVSYIPHEVGLIKINILWNGKEIFNSPFTSTVTNPERVTIVGNESESISRVRINEQKIIRFETANAGPGVLKAKLENFENKLIPIDLTQQGTIYTLKFTVHNEGRYDLTVIYANQLLPSMPIRIDAQSMTQDYTKVKVFGQGLVEARVNEQIEFTIDASKFSNEKVSKPIVRLTNSDRTINVRIQEFDKHPNVFRCSYKPTFPGIYSLSILLLNKEIHGSPFKISVSSATIKPSSSSRVICSGDALHVGIVDKEMECLIDARHANPGELTAYCQGSHKNAACRLVDHQNGTFALFIKPEETGKHTLTIKYNGEHIPGSPFTVKVSGAPDARKVRVSGPGIEHGVLSNFRSEFICETKGAGPGQLTVKIRGPKGAFHVEMERDPLRDRTIICQYNPSEPGDYLLSVKWSGEHVYGSPFHTHIFSTQQELDEYQHELNSYRLIGSKRKDLF